MSAMEEIVATRRSLADDVENNRVEDTDAVHKVCALGDRLPLDDYSDSVIRNYGDPSRGAIRRPIDLI